jgi:hypothetical protein
MELFYAYDWQRLATYQRLNPLQNDIVIHEHNNWVHFSFKQVDFFNYAFGADNQPLLRNNLADIESFYTSRQINKYRIIVPADCADSRKLLLANHYRPTSCIVKTNFPLHLPVPVDYANTVQFIKTDITNIRDFTAIYLEGFEAIGRDIDEVCNNFKGLLTIPGNELFLMQNKEEYVGIVVLFGSNHHYFLAGGAVIPKHRNQHYHKAALAFRLNKCLQDEAVQSIISYAYKNGISLANMQALHMTKEREFDQYELCL